jgi:hypothetical protein
MTPRIYNPAEHHEMLLRSQKPAELKKALGLDRLGEPVPLNVEVLDTKLTAMFKRRTMAFTCENGADCICHMLTPMGLREGQKLPAIICLSGHGSDVHGAIGRSGMGANSTATDPDVAFALQAVAHGFIALAVEMRGFGDRADKPLRGGEGSGCDEEAMRALMLGRTLAGERVWDTMRAIDLLETIPEVDKDQICCLGFSGGGVAAFYTSCVDPRIYLTVGACSFCTYADSIFSLRHCTDNYIPGILRIAEMSDLCGFGARRAFGAAQRIFGVAGNRDNIHLFEFEGAHRFYPRETWNAIRAMVTHE